MHKFWEVPYVFLQQEGKWKENGSVEHLWHASCKSSRSERGAPSVAAKKLHSGETKRKRENRKGWGGGGGGVKEYKLRSDLCGWLKPTQRENAFPSYLTWKHTWGEKQSTKHDAMLPRLRSLLKTWQLKKKKKKPWCKFTLWGKHKENHLFI